MLPLLVLRSVRHMRTICSHVHNHLITSLMARSNISRASVFKDATGGVVVAKWLTRCSQIQGGPVRFSSSATEPMQIRNGNSCPSVPSGRFSANHSLAKEAGLVAREWWLCRYSLEEIKTSSWRRP